MNRGDCVAVHSEVVGKGAQPARPRIFRLAVQPSRTVDLCLRPHGPPTTSGYTDREGRSSRFTGHRNRGENSISRLSSTHSHFRPFVSDFANSGSNPEIPREFTGHKTASVHGSAPTSNAKPSRLLAMTFPPWQRFEASRGGNLRRTRIRAGKLSPVGDKRQDSHRYSIPFTVSRWTPAIPFGSTDLSCWKYTGDSICC